MRAPPNGVSSFHQQGRLVWKNDLEKSFLLLTNLNR